MLLTNFDLLFFSTELVYLKHFVRYLSRQLLEKRYREIIPGEKCQFSSQIAIHYCEFLVLRILEYIKNFLAP